MGLNLFIIFSFLFVATSIAYIIITRKSYLKILKFSIFLFGIFTIIIIIGLSLIPYLLQQKDEASILQYEKNIDTFEEYSEDYRQAAQQQIEEYSRLQSEMSRTATVEQLRFWSEQRDEVSDSISEKINEYQENILEQKLLINEAKSRVEIRITNKWFFLLD